MAINIPVAGVSYPFPTTNDVDWGAQLVAWARAVSAAADDGGGFVPNNYDVTAAAYGAVGDGLTDDTAAIQAALNAAPANSQVVIPEGSYKTSKPVYFGSSTRVHLRGDSVRSSMLSPTAFAGPAVYMRATETPNATGAPLVGSTGYSLYFPSTAGNAWVGLDLRETGQVEMHGWTAFCIEGYWKPEANDGVFIASNGKVMRGDTGVAGASGDRAIYIYRSGTQIVIDCCLSTGYFTLFTGGNIANGATAHIAVNYNGAKLECFLNGVSVGSVAKTGTVVQKKWESMVLGATFTGMLNTELLAGGPNGWVDQIHISSQSRYTANFTPPTTRNDNRGGDALWLGCEETYGPFIVGGIHSGWKAYLPTQYNNLNTTSRLAVSDITIASPTTGIHASGVTDLSIDNIRVTAAAVGALHSNNNSFFSFMRRLDLQTASNSRYGLAVTVASGVLHVDDVKMSCPSWPLSILQSDSTDLCNVFIQDAHDPIFINGQAGTAGFMSRHSLQGVLFDSEGVVIVPRSCLALSDAGSVALIASGFDTGALTAPHVEMDGINAVEESGSVFAGTATTQLFKVNSGNAGAKSVRAHVEANVTTPAAAWTLSAALPLVLSDGNGSRLTYTDASGTPGAATINKPMGKVAIAAGAASVVVTNSLVTADSHVEAVLQFGDATLTQILRVVPGAGSFTVTGNANATAATKVSFKVTNPAV